jgi:S1 RNA binding domain
MLTPERTHPAEPGVVFFAMPFGQKATGGGELCDFDAIYTSAFAPTVQACRMKPERLDDLYGPQGVLELIWRAIQRAEIVVIDFSTRNANVTFEYGLAWTLGKRVIALTQDEDDIPSDVRGLNRFIHYTQHFSDVEKMKQELALQLLALREETPEERAPMPYHVGEMSAVPAPANVIAVSQDYALVQTDDGRLGVLRSGDVEYGRFIRDMTRRYSVGERIEGAFLVDPQRGEARYTLLAGQANPWTGLPSRFPVGAAYRGTVRKVVSDLGVFVGVDGPVSGLIPQASITGPTPLVGDSVDVIVTRMDAVKRQVALRLAAAPPHSSAAPPRLAPTLAAPGYRAFGTVTRIVPEQDGRGGFLLLRLPQHERPALLLAQQMSEELRADLNNRQVEIGEEIYVEVTSVDTSRNKVLLRELPDPQEAEPAASAA